MKTNHYNRELISIILERFGEDDRDKEKREEKQSLYLQNRSNCCMEEPTRVIFIENENRNTKLKFELNQKLSHTL